jgi:Kef-type K+ transport system membrane component KefB/nucleotide-binding universal stress UspA family protein
MFSAGLVVDFHQFMRVKTRSLVFGVLTFSIPLGLGSALGWIIHLEWLGCILLGSAFASHTLLAFPILNKLGATRDEAVAVTAGATILTDIGAFIILAVVLGADEGGLETTYFVQLIGSLIIFALGILFLLPKLGKWFFKRFSGSTVEFQFVIVMLFIAALGAKLIGVHEVVGAFLAGLEINVSLPKHSPVTGHVLFMGESFFVPIFLLYSGMITDSLTLLRNPQASLLAVGILMVAYLSKLMASFITARIYRYSKAEFWTMYGLSHAQAAVTIPTLLIGLNLDLFTPEIFNAAMVMILLTSISSPLIVQKVAPGLGKMDIEEKEIPLFHRILVPIANPATQEYLLSLGGLLAKSGHGEVIALNVVIDQERQHNNLLLQKELLDKVPELLNDPETRYELVPRLADSYARGILQVSREKECSLILMGWRGKRTFKQNILGSVLDEVIWGSNTPVMIGKLTFPLNGMERILLLIPEGAVSPVALRRVLQANLTLAHVLNVPLEILAHKDFLLLIREILGRNHGDVKVTVKEMLGSLRPLDLETKIKSDLVVIPGFGSRKRFISNLGNLPERLADSFSGNLIILHFDR